MRKRKKPDTRNVPTHDERVEHAAMAVGSLLKIAAAVDVSKLDEGQFSAVISLYGELMQAVVSKDVRFLLVISDVNGRTQVTSTYETPGHAARVMESVGNTCREMNQSFVERN